jgi:uncharacterized membrane protein
MTRTRWLILALLLSLSVNLFVGGLVVGRMIEYHGPWGGGRMWGGPPPPPDGPGPRWLRRMLGPEGMPALNAAWQEHRETIDPLREQVWATRIAVADALGAVPFVREDYEAALAASRTVRAAHRAAMDAAITDLVAGLTPEQRVEFAERVKAWVERRRAR